MLIEFSVANYLSFRNKATFSLQASSIKELEITHTFDIDNFRLIKSAVIYGANASGKSNLLKAMKFMRKMVLHSSKDTQVEEDIDVQNFKLDSNCENIPSFFEIVFIEERTLFRYGFQLDSKKIHDEWLFYTPEKRESSLFLRESGSFKLNNNKFKEGKGLEDKTRNNALFLSVAAQFNGEISKKVLKWFKKFMHISGVEDQSYLPFTIEELEKKSTKKEILRLLKVADFGIKDIQSETLELDHTNLPDDLPLNLKELFSKEKLDGIKSARISTLHQKYDDKNTSFSLVAFNLKTEESHGTQKFFALTGPILDVLKNGYILVIDELDARLHPLLTLFIVELFNDKITNPLNAQLIFATHDTNLLDKKFFRRDQIWFTEKDKFGSTELYSLVEYKEENKKIRNDASYEKDYILGKYGAIPSIGDYKILLELEDAAKAMEKK